MKDFRSNEPADARLRAFAFIATSVFFLLGGALLAGSLGGGPGLAVGGAGFAAYLFFFARAFRAGGAARHDGTRIDALL